MKIMELQNLGFVMHQTSNKGTPGGIFITDDKKEMNELQAVLIVRSVGDVELVEEYNLELENGRLQRYSTFTKDRLSAES